MGDHLVFSKDIGGNEFFQFYRFDLATGEATLLTDGKSRNTGWNWSNAGDRADLQFDAPEWSRHGLLHY